MPLVVHLGDQWLLPHSIMRLSICLLVFKMIIESHGTLRTVNLTFWPYVDMHKLYADDFKFRRKIMKQMKHGKITVHYAKQNEQQQNYLTERS
jgi:hypothetical protein